MSTASIMIAAGRWGRLLSSQIVNAYRILLPAIIPNNRRVFVLGQFFLSFYAFALSFPAWKRSMVYEWFYCRSFMSISSIFVRLRDILASIFADTSEHWLPTKSTNSIRRWICSNFRVSIKAPYIVTASISIWFDKFRRIDKPKTYYFGAVYLCHSIDLKAIRNKSKSRLWYIANGIKWILLSWINVSEKKLQKNGILYVPGPVGMKSMERKKWSNMSMTLSFGLVCLQLISQHAARV